MRYFMAPAILSVREIFDLIVMTAALGYIFMSYIQVGRPSILGASHFNWDDFKFAALVTAPGIILHELAHKFVGLAVGLTAVFHASYFGLAIGVFLKLIHSPFIIFAPGYVSLGGENIAPLLSALTAFVGPFMNLALFFIAREILERKRKLTRRQAVALYLTKQINLFLFIFNMLPIPPFDGSKVFYGLYKAIF